MISEPQLLADTSESSSRTYPKTQQASPRRHQKAPSQTRRSVPSSARTPAQDPPPGTPPPESSAQTSPPETLGRQDLHLAPARVQHPPAPPATRPTTSDTAPSVSPASF